MIDIRGHRIDLARVEYYKRSISSSPGWRDIPGVLFYYVSIGMKSGKELTISCKDEDDTDKLLKRFDKLIIKK